MSRFCRAMTQQVAYGLQRYGGVQQTACSREAEGMSPVAALHFDAGLLQPPLDDGVQRASPGKGAMWRPNAQEYFTNVCLLSAVP